MKKYYKKSFLVFVTLITVMGVVVIWEIKAREVFVNLLQFKRDNTQTFPAIKERKKSIIKQIFPRNTFPKSSSESKSLFPQELVQFENSVQHGNEQAIEFEFQPYAPAVDPVGPFGPTGEQMATTCSASEIIVLDGQDLVNFLRTHDYSGCIYNLWSYSADVASVFTDENMIAVANELKLVSAVYQGNNNEHIKELIIFLRIGYYHEIDHTAEVPFEKESIEEAVFEAFDTFAVNEYINDISDAASEILAQWITTVDTVGYGYRYFELLKTIMHEFINDEERKTYRNQSLIAYSILHILQRPQTNELDTVMDESMIDNVTTLAKDTWLIENETWLVNTAVWSLGYISNLEQWKETIAVKLTELLDYYTRYTEPWLWTVAAIDYFLDCQTSDPGRTICREDIIPEMEKILFPYEYVFDDGTLVVRTPLPYETVERLSFAVLQVQSQFQRVSETITPIASDANTTLTMIIYGSKSDYQAYQNYLYGLSTNNGGIYIENWESLQGVFFTYERTPSESVYTLEDLTRHEFVHYLQGRWLIEGNYGEGDIYDNDRIVWMTEGLAEFLAGSTSFEGVKPRKTLVQLVQNDGTNRLNVDQIVRATYNTSGVYEYSGLFFQYLYENQIEILRKIIKYVNEGDVENYDTLMETLATDAQLNINFQSYLDDLIVNIASLTNPYVAYPPVSELVSSSLEEIESVFKKAWNGSLRGCSIATVESIPRFSCRSTTTGQSTDQENFAAAWGNFDQTLNKIIQTSMATPLEKQDGSTILINNFEAMNCRFGAIYYGDSRNSGIYPLVDFYCDGPLAQNNFTLLEPLEQVTQDFHSTRFGYIAQCSNEANNQILCDLTLTTVSRAISERDTVFSEEIENSLRGLQNEVYALRPTYYRDFSCQYNGEMYFQQIENDTQKYALRKVQCLTKIYTTSECLDECNENESICFDDRKSDCGNFDPDSCREWGDLNECQNGTECAGGVCSS